MKRKGSRSKRGRKMKRTRMTAETIRKTLNPKSTFQRHAIAAYVSSATESNNPCSWFVPHIQCRPSDLKDICDATGEASALADVSSTRYTATISDYVSKHKVKNVFIHPVWLTVYECVVRDTSYRSTTTSTYENLEKQIMYDFATGLQAVYNGTVDALYVDNGGAPDADLYQDGDTQFFSKRPRLRPFDSKLFTSNYLIKKVHKYFLKPNQSIILKKKTKQHKYNSLVDATAYQPAYAGYTKFYLCEMYGDLGLASDNTPGYGQSKIVWEREFKAHCCLTNDKAEQIGQQGSVVEFPASGTAIFQPGDRNQDDA